MVVTFYLDKESSSWSLSIESDKTHINVSPLHHSFLIMIVMSLFIEIECNK